MQALFGLVAGAAGAFPAAPAAAAATTAATTGGLGSVIYGAPAAAAATSGFSISQLLAGGATVLSTVASISAADAQGDALEAQAAEAQAQKPLELIEGLSRRNEIKKATMSAVADQDVAYAASGADLSFGTPRQARSNAFREGDHALNTNALTIGATLDQLDLRSKTYLGMASRARSLGWLEGLTTAGLGFSRLGTIG